MTIREILKDGDPRLRQKCAEVVTFDDELQALARDMAETVVAANGLGLAAPQVGEMKRVIVLFDPANKSVLPLVNPVIVQSSQPMLASETEYEEGCLSFPNVFRRKTRFKYVTVSYQGIDGVTRELKCRKQMAVCVQHELDHLDGVCIV